MSNKTFYVFQDKAFWFVAGSCSLSNQSFNFKEQCASSIHESQSFACNTKSLTWETSKNHIKCVFHILNKHIPYIISDFFLRMLMMQGFNGTRFYLRSKNTFRL